MKSNIKIISVVFVSVLLVGIIFYSITSITDKQPLFIINDNSSETNSMSDSQINSTITIVTTMVATQSETSTKTITTTLITSESQTETTTYYEFPADINDVTKEQLMEINGIGEVTADKIINYRSEIGVIYNMDILMDISGIGESTLALLKEYLYVSESDYRDIEEYAETQEPAHTEVTSADTERVYTEKPPETTAAISNTTAQTTTTTAEPVMQCVNVNEADAEEISEKLMIDIEIAQSIVEVREKIQVYTNALELLYAKGMTESKLAELWDYIIL